MNHDLRDELRKSLPSLGDEVAKELGEGWTSKPQHENGVKLYGPDGAELWLSVAWPSDSKVNISGAYPFGSYPRSRTDINVTPSRGPAVIAKEIRRRLLPAYLPVLAEAQEQVRRNQAAEAARQATIGRIVAAFPGSTVHENSVYVRYGNGGCRLDVQYSGTTVHLYDYYPVDAVLVMLDHIRNTAAREQA